MNLLDSHFDRITSVWQQFTVAAHAISSFLALCRADPTRLPGPQARVRDVQRCHEGLAGVYLVRLFAEFEGALREFWRRGCGRRTSPPAEVLINRVAARCSVPRDDLAAAQEVRSVRNELVHQGQALSRMHLSSARRYLGKFLSHLPRRW